MNTVTFILAAATAVMLTSCGPSEEQARREAEHNAEVSRSLMKSEHVWGSSGSMTGPGNH